MAKNDLKSDLGRIVRQTMPDIVGPADLLYLRKTKKDVEELEQIAFRQGMLDHLEHHFLKLRK